MVVAIGTVAMATISLATDVLKMFHCNLTVVLLR